MKKLSLLLVTGIISCWMFNVSAQSDTTITENFDGNTISFTPANAWSKNSVYYESPPYSYRGKSPNTIGDTVVLTTPTYDLSKYSYIFLHFKHICKISPRDITRIEYRYSNQSWRPVPAAVYMGGASNYVSTGFNAGSYPEWQANDSTVMPAQSWWKEEVFDIGTLVGNASGVQFRFIIRHGSIAGTHLSYGWLLDDFEIEASLFEKTPPIVEFLPLFVRDTVYGTGPWTINAKVKTQTIAQIETPWIKYTATQNGIIVANDSVIMEHVHGDSLWKGSIPQFIVGTTVQYSITGRDINGNDAKISSNYIIARGTEGSIILQDGSTNTGYYPFQHDYGYSRSMVLYPAAEMSEKVGGLIRSISLRVATAGSGSFPMKVWLKTVPPAKTTWDNSDNLDWSVLTADVVLLYDGNFHFNRTGWFDIPFNDIFSYNGIDNLVVMFEQNCTGTSCASWMATYSQYYYSSTQVSRYWRKVSDNAPPTANSTLYIGYPFRPDLRINMIGATGDNAAAVHSIDLNDTLIVSANSNIPVAVTIKNKGTLNLDSVNVSYSINGAAAVTQTRRLNSLASDLNYPDTLGTYNPKVNGHDTITVWVDLPNGQLDNVSYDDTLTKIIYGSSDISMHFIDIPADTIYDTGPFEITAEINSLSGATIGQVSLYTISVFEGNPTFDTLTMHNTSGNLWKVSIPKKIIGTDVHYSIILTDALGNKVELKNSYYINRLPSGFTGEVTIGSSGTFGFYSPIMMFYEYGWTRQLYLGTEIAAGATGGTITKLSWSYYTSTAVTIPNQSCYFRVVDDTEITSTAYEDPGVAGATQVWQGNLNVPAGPCWVEIPITSFELPPGKNLLIYWHSNGKTYSYERWYHTATTKNMTVYKGDGASFPTTAGTLNTARPDVRFYIQGSGADSNSVAIASIDSPEKIAAVAGTGVSVPVRVTIQNTGIKNLTNCILNWSLNGIVHSNTTYNGNLSEQFTDTITIGSYTPIIGKIDTIVVWVSMPNGEVDPTTEDDTSSIYSSGCGTLLSGTVRVGNGETFTTLSEVLSRIHDCGVAGNVTLAIKGKFNENIDLTDISNNMNGYSLTITSLDNDPDSAIIQPSSGVGITLLNTRNLTIKNITVDATLSGTNAIEFTGTCTNIVVRDCKLLANPTSTDPAHNLVYKGFGTGYADRVFFISNRMDGGYAGFYFYEGKNATLDSNQLSNQYLYGFYSNRSDFTSCSYNTILSRTTQTDVQWYGFYLNGNNGPITGNRVIQRSSAIIQPYGMYFYEHNFSLNRTLVANNEIILNIDGTGTYSGIYAERSKLEILHNSIYVTGTGAARGLHIQNSVWNDIIVKNNSIVMLSSTAYPIYSSLPNNPHLHIFDYNNYYAPVNVGYWGGDITTIAAWQAATISNDPNSVSMLPYFLLIHPMILNM